MLLLGKQHNLLMLLQCQGCSSSKKASGELPAAALRPPAAAPAADLLAPAAEVPAETLLCTSEPCFRKSKTSAMDSDHVAVLLQQVRTSATPVKLQQCDVVSSVTTDLVQTVQASGSSKQGSEDAKDAVEEVTRLTDVHVSSIAT